MVGVVFSGASCAVAPGGGGNANDNGQDNDNTADNTNDNEDSNANDNGDPGDGGTWTEAAEIFAPDAAPGDRFGFSIAADGDTLVVGAAARDDNQGAAYVYRLGNGQWEYESTLNGEAIFNPQSFGTYVAVQGDEIFVGAPNYAPEGSFTFQVGAVYVFGRDATGWTRKQLLTGSNAESQDYLGFTLAVDGDVLVAGAWGRNTLEGVVYVFRKTGDTWVEEQVLSSSNGINFDRFGQAVAVQGNTIVVGAPVRDFGTGETYVFEYQGGAWVETANFLAPFPAETDQFGSAVALQGDTLVSSSVLRDGIGVLETGEAYVYERTGSSWLYQQTLTAEDPFIGRHFGTSIDLEGDLMAIGAPVVSAVYVFRRTGGEWQSAARLMPAASRALYDLYGTSVALLNGVVLGGAMTSAESGLGESGAAYVFEP